jgi:hypothetical protein
MMTEFVTVVSDDIARAWLDTVLAVAALPDHKAFHTVTRIRSVAGGGELRIHQAASDLLGEFDLQPLDTVANTIFPAAMARRTPDIAALRDRYEEIYPQLKRLAPTKNRYGTYFHRLVAYPGPNGPVNQLEQVITSLGSELSSDSPKRARYEASLETPADATDVVDGDAEDGQSDADALAETAATPVFTPGRDIRLMGFPCLSFLSFQHDKVNLHAVAHYRSQYLMERGLGNYLGISQLLRYLAQQVGLQPGGLTVVAGQAYADHLRKVNIAELEALRAALDDAAATSETTGLPADVR